MANQETVIGLLYSVKESIKLDITEYEWPKDYKLNYFDFAVSFEHGGRKFIGRGVDKVEAIAIEKAASESLERYICYKNNIDSFGLSVGIDYECDEHAKFEALERHYLNQHILKSIKLTKHNISSSDLINNFANDNSDVKIDFLRMLTSDHNFGIICILTKGAIKSIGFSYSNNEQTSVEKSFIEALPNLAWKLQNNHDDKEMPWHLKDEFISQIERLSEINSKDPSDAINSPVLVKINISLSDLQLLSCSKVRAVKYVIKDSAE